MTVEQIVKYTALAKRRSELSLCSGSKAYQYIRIMNAELQEKGFLTVRGKIPAAYVKERFFGMPVEQKEHRA